MSLHVQNQGLRASLEGLGRPTIYASVVMLVELWLIFGGWLLPCGRAYRSAASDWATIHRGGVGQRRFSTPAPQKVAVTMVCGCDCDMSRIVDAYKEEGLTLAASVLAFVTYLLEGHINIYFEPNFSTSPHLDLSSLFCSIFIFIPNS